MIGRGVRSVWLKCLIGCVFALETYAQETYGLQNAKYDQPDPVFRNGFENAVVRLAKGIGLGPPLTTVMPRRSA